jgi:hypothetical protein
MTQPFYINKKEGMINNEPSTKWKNSKYSFTFKNDDSQSATSNYSNIQLPILNAVSSVIEPFGEDINRKKKSEQSMRSFDKGTKETATAEKIEDIDAVQVNPDVNELSKNISTRYRNVLQNWENPLTGEKHTDISVDDMDMIGLNARETRLEYTRDADTPEKYLLATMNRDISQRDGIKPQVPPSTEEEDDTGDTNQPNEDKKNANTKTQTEISPHRKNNNIVKRFKAFFADKTFKNAKLLAVAILENIPELFFIPEMIAVAIVRSSTPKNKRSGPNYSQNKFKLSKHFKSFMVILICIYITFNWWYLMFYTDHYIDIYNLLKSPFLIPLLWIIGPVLSPFASLNYYLLGKRLEPEFFSKHMEPALKNKPIYLSILLLIVVLLYDKIIEIFTSNMKDLVGSSKKKGPQTLFAIIAGLAVLKFLYSVVFDEDKNTKFINKVSFALSILFYIIMVIMIIMMCKAISGVILIYLMFYSFFFLFISEGFNTPNKIIEMIVDTTEVCVKDTESRFGKLKNILYKYSFLIFIFGILAVRIIHAFVDLRTITEKRVRVSCYALYSALALGLIVFTTISFWRVFQNIYSAVAVSEPAPADSTSTPDSTSSSEPPSAKVTMEPLPPAPSKLDTFFENFTDIIARWVNYIRKSVMNMIT